MTVQRLVSSEDRSRRGVGLFVAGLATAFTAWLVWLGSQAPGATAKTLAFCVLPIALAAWGVRLARRPGVVLEVDPEGRVFTLIRDGQRGPSGALESLAPLSVSMRTRSVGSRGRKRTIIEYAVHPAPPNAIDLQVFRTPGRARKRMEALAKAWGLPSQAYRGALRPPGQLDLPLHERLRGNREASSVMPLLADWGVSVEPRGQGYAVVSRHRSQLTLGVSLFLMLPAGFALLVAHNTGLLSSLAADAGPLEDQIVAGGFALVIVWILAKILRGLWNVFLPGTVRITEGGVSYRGARMAFGEIEEVTAGVPIEIVGDRRILSLAETFCPLDASEAVAHELQRLILEVGSSSRF